MVPGCCSIPSYELNELLGTKLSALYQRKKGRDLFDLAISLDNKHADPDTIIDTFNAYMKRGGRKVTKIQFRENIALKMQDKNFTSDIGPLLASDFQWNLDEMSLKVNEQLISRLAD